MRTRTLAIRTSLVAVAALAALAPVSAVARSHPMNHNRHINHGGSTRSFYARVVRASARGLVVKTMSGRTLSFSTAQINRSMPAAKASLKPAYDVHYSSGNVIINILGLQPGTVVMITETIGSDGAITVTIQLPAAPPPESASGVVTNVESDAFDLQLADGSDLRLHMAADQLAALSLNVCDTVDVTYHQDGGLLIADAVTTTGGSTSGDCTPTMDATGAITRVSADSVTIATTDSGPQSFSVDSSSGLTDGFQVGDLVDVTFVQNSDGSSTATDIQYVEEWASGQVTSVTTSSTGGSVTITDDGNGASETFAADPSNGVQINAHAFNGVTIGEHISICYHQVAGQWVADTVTEL